MLVGAVAFALDLDLSSSGVMGPPPTSSDDTYFAWERRPTTVATIALNGFDSRALVASLRGPGRWRGDVVVLGDRCSPGPPEGPVGARYVLALEEGADDDDTAPKDGGVLSRALTAKALKTRLFELAAPTSSSSVLYLDSDIEVNRPLAPFLEALRRTMADKAFEVRKRKHSSRPPSYGCSRVASRIIGS
jgi:hypothetical protein